MKGRSKPLPLPLTLSRNLRKMPRTFKSPAEAKQNLMQHVDETYANQLMKELVKNEQGRYEFLSNEAVVLLYSPQGLQEDFTAALQTAKTPLLFLAADPEKNAVLFGVGLDHLRVTRPDAKVEVFAGAGHNIHKDATDKFINIVEQFLGR